MILRLEIMKKYFFKILFEIGSASKEKTQFSDHLRSGLKVQNLLLIAKRSNIIVHIWKKIFCLVSISLLKPKTAIFGLIWCPSKFRKISMSTPVFFFHIS